MPKAFATGNLSEVTDASEKIWMPGEYTGALGLLFTGAFGGIGGTIVLEVSSYRGATPRNLKIVNPANADVTQLQYSAPGLYYVEAFLDDLKLKLYSGQAGVTDIDWTLFLKPRP